VIKDLPNHYSNWRATQSLDSFLTSKKTIGIANIDTRALTAKLRDHGSSQSLHSSWRPRALYHQLKKL
jgi:carbamoyl-phosphate synthase small subunit